ncbi:unnamed protein product [Arctia plantaginis]|uniref:Uncharacterized protein n=1 Tax=Arctia plantaginis TaxID=874455 RepID=A0A8S1BI84_ARCPL|nr:unnamed protein product [Arctia plantaginis]
MYFLLVITILLRDECRSIEIVAKKTPILRSANDDIKIDLRTARKPDDILKQLALPTSEPPDFMDNKYTGFSLPTKKSTSFSSPVIDVYTTNMDKEETNGNTNFFVTLQAISKQTTRKVKKPPKVQDQLMAKDPAAFWADVATHGHWSHLDSYLTISYWKNSNRTSTYATKLTTRSRTTRGKRTRNTSLTYKLPIVTDGKPPSEPDDAYDRRRHGEDSQTRIPDILSRKSTTQRP